MKLTLTPTSDHQQEMRYAYYDGAPGIFVSGLVWIMAAFVSYKFAMHVGVWTLLIGGALIHPVSILFNKAMGRPAKTSNSNALNQLIAASTIWLILGCAMAYGLYYLKPELFFPTMMATIGCRYLVFATVFGRAIFWVLGGALIAAANLFFFLAIPPVIAAGVCGLIEVVFAYLVFSTASK